jgi:hypothetical protein
MKDRVQAMQRPIIQLSPFSFQLRAMARLRLQRRNPDDRHRTLC